MFTDETKIDVSPFLRESIRLIKLNNKKLKEGDLNIYNSIKLIDNNNNNKNYLRHLNDKILIEEKEKEDNDTLNILSKKI